MIYVRYPVLQQITRTITVSLTEDSGDYYLNFFYKRQASPNDSRWYIEPSVPFGNEAHADTTQIGTGTSYELVSDVIGETFAYTHDGADNVTPGNGTEDANVSITVEHIQIDNTIAT